MMRLVLLLSVIVLPVVLGRTRIGKWWAIAWLALVHLLIVYVLVDWIGIGGTGEFDAFLIVLGNYIETHRLAIFITLVVVSVLLFLFSRWLKTRGIKRE